MRRSGLRFDSSEDSSFALNQAGVRLLRFAHNVRIWCVAGGLHRPGAAPACFRCRSRKATSVLWFSSVKKLRRRGAVPRITISAASTPALCNTFTISRLCSSGTVVSASPCWIRKGGVSRLT